MADARGTLGPNRPSEPLRTIHLNRRYLCEADIIPSVDCGRLVQGHPVYMAYQLERKLFPR